MRRTPRRAASSADPRGSRTVTDSLLSDLRRDRHRPAGWVRFLARATAQSIRDAAERPQAVLQLTALHAGLAALRVERDRAGLRWIGCSWALAVTHLGLLEDRRGLGIADMLTLVRANLPAVAPRAKTAVVVGAVAADVLDGPLARWSGTATPFGRDADSLADAAFWIWYVGRHESSALMRMLLRAVWGVPVVGMTVLSVARGRIVEPSWPRWLRPATPLEAVLLVRALRRRPQRPGADRTPRCPA